MSPGRIRSVAIIGGGPSGALLAHHLGRAGLAVALFDRAQRPPLVVGESLVPATVGFMRELGIEEEVRGYSTFKPGATFVFGPDDVFNLRFEDVRAAKFKYSYNVPRDKLDASITAVAEKSGALLIRDSAQLERVEGSDRVRLSDETLERTRAEARHRPGGTRGERSRGEGRQRERGPVQGLWPVHRVLPPGRAGAGDGQSSQGHLPGKMHSLPLV